MSNLDDFLKNRRSAASSNGGGNALDSFLASRKRTAAKRNQYDNGQIWDAPEEGYEDSGKWFYNPETHKREQVPYDPAAYPHQQIDKYTEQIEENGGTPVAPDNSNPYERGGVQKVFDAIFPLGYGVTNAIKSTIDNDPNTTVVDNFIKGIKAAYSDTEEAAMNRATTTDLGRTLEENSSSSFGKTAGKVLQNPVVGFAGDILLDPSSYFTGVFKAGSLMAKGAEGLNAAEKIGNIDKAKKVLSDLGRLSDDPVVAQKQAEDLFNKTAQELGYMNGYKGIRAEIPFTNKGITLLKAEHIAKAGDSSIGKILGSPLIYSSKAIDGALNAVKNSEFAVKLAGQANYNLIQAARKEPDRAMEYILAKETIFKRRLGEMFADIAGVHAATKDLEKKVGKNNSDVVNAVENYDKKVTKTESVTEEVTEANPEYKSKANDFRMEQMRQTEEEMQHYKYIISERQANGQIGDDMMDNIKALLNLQRKRVMIDKFSNVSSTSFVKALQDSGLDPALVKEVGDSNAGDIIDPTVWARKNINECFEYVKEKMPHWSDDDAMSFAIGMKGVADGVMEKLRIANPEFADTINGVVRQFFDESDETINYQEKFAAGRMRNMADELVNGDYERHLDPGSYKEYVESYNLMKQNEKMHAKALKQLERYQRKLEGMGTRDREYKEYSEWVAHYEMVLSNLENNHAKHKAQVEAFTKEALMNKKKGFKFAEPDATKDSTKKFWEKESGWKNYWDEANHDPKEWAQIQAREEARKRFENFKANFDYRKPKFPDIENYNNKNGYTNAKKEFDHNLDVIEKLKQQLDAITPKTYKFKSKYAGNIPIEDPKILREKYWKDPEAIKIAEHNEAIKPGVLLQQEKHETEKSIAYYQLRNRELVHEGLIDAKTQTAPKSLSEGLEAPPPEMKIGAVQDPIKPTSVIDKTTGKPIEMNKQVNVGETIKEKGYSAEEVERKNQLLKQIIRYRKALNLQTDDKFMEIYTNKNADMLAFDAEKLKIKDKTREILGEKTIRLQNTPISAGNDINKPVSAHVEDLKNRLNETITKDSEKYDFTVYENGIVDHSTGKDISFPTDQGGMYIFSKVLEARLAGTSKYGKQVRMRRGVVEEPEKFDILGTEVDVPPGMDVDEILDQMKKHAEYSTKKFFKQGYKENKKLLAEGMNKEEATLVDIAEQYGILNSKSGLTEVDIADLTDLEKKQFIADGLKYMWEESADKLVRDKKAKMADDKLDLFKAIRKPWIYGKDPLISNISDAELMDAVERMTRDQIYPTKDSVAGIPTREREVNLYDYIANKRDMSYDLQQMHYTKVYDKSGTRNIEKEKEINSKNMSTDEHIFSGVNAIGKTKNTRNVASNINGPKGMPGQGDKPGYMGSNTSKYSSSAKYYDNGDSRYIPGIGYDYIKNKKGEMEFRPNEFAYEDKDLQRQDWQTIIEASRPGMYKNTGRYAINAEVSTVDDMLLEDAWQGGHNRKDMLESYMQYKYTPHDELVKLSDEDLNIAKKEDDFDPTTDNPSETYSPRKREILESLYNRRIIEDGLSPSEYMTDGSTMTDKQLVDAINEYEETRTALFQFKKGKKKATNKQIDALARKMYVLKKKNPLAAQKVDEYIHGMEQAKQRAGMKTIADIIGTEENAIQKIFNGASKGAAKKEPKRTMADIDELFKKVQEGLDQAIDPDSIKDEKFKVTVTDKLDKDGKPMFDLDGKKETTSELDPIKQVNYSLEYLNKTLHDQISLWLEDCTKRGQASIKEFMQIKRVAEDEITRHLSMPPKDYADTMLSYGILGSVRTKLNALVKETNKQMEKKGMVRLYRGEPAKASYEAGSYKGRFYVASKKEAEKYAGEAGHVVYVDVPAKKANKYLLKNQPDLIKKGVKSESTEKFSNPAKDYYIPEEYRNKRTGLVKADDMDILQEDWSAAKNGLDYVNALRDKCEKEMDAVVDKRKRGNAGMIKFGKWVELVDHANQRLIRYANEAEGKYLKKQIEAVQLAQKEYNVIKTTGHYKVMEDIMARMDNEATFIHGSTGKYIPGGIQAAGEETPSFLKGNTVLNSYDNRRLDYKEQGFGSSTDIDGVIHPNPYTDYYELKLPDGETVYVDMNADFSTITDAIEHYRKQPEELKTGTSLYINADKGMEANIINGKRINISEQHTNKGHAITHEAWHAAGVRPEAAPYVQRAMNAWNRSMESKNVFQREEILQMLRDNGVKISDENFEKGFVSDYHATHAGTDLADQEGFAEIAGCFYNPLTADRMQAHFPDMYRDIKETLVGMPVQRITARIPELHPAKAEMLEDIERYKQILHATDFNSVTSFAEAEGLWKELKYMDDKNLIAHAERETRRIYGKEFADHCQTPKMRTLEKTFDKEITTNHIDQYSEDVKAIAKWLHEEFDGIADSEDIDKIANYLPHILNPTLNKKDTATAVDNLKKKGIKVEDPKNMYSLHREIPGTIEEINKSKKLETGIEDFFDTNVARLYMKRAIANKKFLYKKNVLQDMLSIFGHRIKKREDFMAAGDIHGRIKYLKEQIGNLGGTIPEGPVSEAYLMDVYYNAVRTKKGDKDTVFLVLNPKYEKSEARVVSDEAMEAGYSNRNMHRENIRATKDALDPDSAIQEVLDVELENPFIMVDPTMMTKEQFFKYTNDGTYIMPKRAYEGYMKTMESQFRTEKSAFVKALTKYTRLFKVHVTQINPSFHVNNLIGNMWQSWLGCGTGIARPDVQAETMKAVVAFNKGKLKSKMWNGMTGEEFMLFCREHGIIENTISNEHSREFITGQTNKINRKGYSINSIKKFINPIDEENFAIYKAGYAVGGTIENHAKLANFIYWLKKGDIPEVAAYKTNKYLFDYNDLSDFEQRVMKQIIPFYTWMRKNVPLQIEQLFAQPEKFIAARSAMRNFSNLRGEPETDQQKMLKPDYLENAIPMGDGKYINVNLPFQDLQKITSFKDMYSSLNPLAKLAVEIPSNKNVYYDSPIKFDEYYKKESPFYTKFFADKDNMVDPMYPYIMNSLLPTLGKVDTAMKNDAKSEEKTQNWIRGTKTVTPDFKQLGDAAMWDYVDKLKSQNDALKRVLKKRQNEK